MLNLFAIGLGLLLLSGCASYGMIENAPQTGPPSAEAYSIRADAGRRGSGDLSLMLAFSGGGTRAAALSYGVLKELRDTTVVIDGRPRRVLDEVDMISSVSGGSFTSAYYGLNGDRIFDDFEDVFLRRDVERQLIRGLFNPLLWFGSTGRTEMAVRLYEEKVFHGATFADMKSSECRYLVKDFGTSQSPKSTRLRDNLCAPAALRSALDSTNTRRAQLRPQMA